MFHRSSALNIVNFICISIPAYSTLSYLFSASDNFISEPVHWLTFIQKTPYEFFLNTTLILSLNIYFFVCNNFDYYILKISYGYTKELSCQFSKIIEFLVYLKNGNQ